jgi:hypothetical protein
LATGLLNHIGDVNLDSITSRSLRPWFRFRNSRTRSYTGPNALIEPKYLPSAHSTTRLMTGVPHRGRSTSTPSATGARASIVPEGVDPPPDRVLDENSIKSFTNRLDDGSRPLGQRGRPKGWIRSPVKNSEYSVFASQSVTRFFLFPWNKLGPHG